MPAAELVVWLIPGYIALLLYLHAYPLRTKQSYEWFFQAAGFGILCFVISRLLLAVGVEGYDRLPCIAQHCPSSEVARALWSEHVPYTYSFSLALGIFVAPVAAGVLVTLRPLWERLKVLTRRVAPKSPVSDIFYFTCVELEEKLVIVTVDGGKVYVGFLVDFTSDPDEPDKYIQLVLLMSGRRPPDQPYVEFTTPYVTSTDQPTPEQLKQWSATRAILVPVKKIVTFAPFDGDLHAWFVARDMVKIKFELDLPQTIA